MTAAHAAEVRAVRDAIAGGPQAQDLGDLVFLEMAVELDEPAVFRDYALWARDRAGADALEVRSRIELLERIPAEAAGRMSSTAAESVARSVRAGVEALSAGDPCPRGDFAGISPACHLYVAAAVTGRRRLALAIVRDAIHVGQAPLDLYVDIFQSALYDVGRRWQAAALTIAEEHMATATTQFILGVLHEEHTRSDGRRGTAVVTGVRGDHHAVGASIVANVLDDDGWDVRLLGTDLPDDTVLWAIASHEPDLLAVSVTLRTSVPAARDLIALVRGSTAPPRRIIVGGAAFRDDPHLWRTTGADGFAADARSVAQVARG